MPEAQSGSQERPWPLGSFVGQEKEVPVFPAVDFGNRYRFAQTGAQIMGHQTLFLGGQMCSWRSALHSDETRTLNHAECSLRHLSESSNSDATCSGHDPDGRIWQFAYGVKARGQQHSCQPTAQNSQGPAIIEAIEKALSAQHLGNTGFHPPTPVLLWACVGLGVRKWLRDELSRKEMVSVPR